MPHIYERIFENFRLLNCENRVIEDTFSKSAVWLDTPGCVIQRSDFHVPISLHTEGLMKPGLYLSIVLSGNGEGGPVDGQARQTYSDNQMVAMLIREPTQCGGTAPAGIFIRAVGVAYPLTSITNLGLEQDFFDLFQQDDRSVLSMLTSAPPRIQAIALEMLSPSLEGRAGELLLGAQATELLARSLDVLQNQAEFKPPVDIKRMRLQSVKALIDSDLRYPWSIAELAYHAGISRRTFNLKFRSAYGSSAMDYIRTSRLLAAREALIHQNLTVAEAAYMVGYSNTANFATAFRKQFGQTPRTCRSQISA